MERKLKTAGVFAVMAALLSASALAETRAEIDAGVNAALEQFYKQDSSHRTLVSNAAAVLVFPRVTKGGAAVGGAFGEGALLEHGKAVAYYKLSAASVGLTLGVGQRREVVLFMTQESLDQFTHSSGWTIGAETGVALVSKGVGGQYDSETLRKPILAFVFGERGLIGDVSLEGTKITKIRA